MSEGQQPGIWRRERADRLSIIIDAQDYFVALRQALLSAQHRILLVGWDFDARIKLHAPDREPGEPETIGAFLYWLVERTPGLEIRLLRWDVGAFKSLFRGSTLFTIIKWARHPRIQLTLDGHHPTASSHHQKLVSIDDCLAFCGGIDMTGDRWDTRDHADDEPRRTQPNGKRYPPWHDATSCMDGAAARALADVCKFRWQAATGDSLPDVSRGGRCWPAGLEPNFTDVDVAIARTFPKMDDQEPIHEVEALFLRQIADARRHLYCESQYFASRRIAEAIARRLDEPDGPEIVIVNPLTAQGWLEPLAMDTARARLMAALRRRDVHGRLAMYHPYTAGGQPIYVHAKITVLDDAELRIGSANMNNRSLRLDTECDVLIQADEDGERERIRAIRDDLIGEHLGVEPARVAEVLEETGSLIATIERLRGHGRSLRPYEIPDLNEVEKWLADNEALDPEGPDEMFEPFARRGLFRRRLKRPRRPR